MSEKGEIGAAHRAQSASLSDVERGMVDFFSDGVRVMGLPRSVGEIYGLLFAREQPLSLDDLVQYLGVSKGTGSQGLKMLRTLGAVKEVTIAGSRKTFYEADVELKSLVGGFIRAEVRPHLESAKGKIEGMRQGVEEGDGFLLDRIDRLDKWRKRAGMLLPILQKLLAT